MLSTSDRFRLGARVETPVWIWDGQWNRPFGTVAEYIVVPADQAMPLPDEVPCQVGLGIRWLTRAGQSTVGLRADHGDRRRGGAVVLSLRHRAA
jgi:NADPH:quinone reductase-like Zn-dependent oxidoreductase